MECSYFVFVFNAKNYWVNLTKTVKKCHISDKYFALRHEACILGH